MEESKYPFMDRFRTHRICVAKSRGGTSESAESTTGKTWN